MKIFKLFLSLAFVVALVSCSSVGDDAKNENETLNIVATTGMIADAARVIGGDKVNVTGLMGPGVDPHLYKASAGDVAVLSKADLIFYNGLQLEGKMGEIFEQMEKRGIDTVAVTDGIDRGVLLTPPEYEGNYDPHLWFDVSLWKQVVAQMSKSLIENDPENAELYGANTDAYLVHKAPRVVFDYSEHEIRIHRELLGEVLCEYQPSRLYYPERITACRDRNTALIGKRERNTFTLVQESELNPGFYVAEVGISLDQIIVLNVQVVDVGAYLEIMERAYGKPDAAPKPRCIAPVVNELEPEERLKLEHTLWNCLCARDDYF